MELTPEERLRIYEEEKEKIGAVPRPRKRLIGYLAAVIVVLLGLSALGYLVWQNGRQRGELDALKRSATEPAPQKQPAGDGEAAKAGGPGQAGKDRLEHAEEGFNADDGCRDLYFRIRDSGGQSPEAIAENLLAADASIRYAQIEKNPIPYYGKPVAISGRIYQVREYPAKDGSYFTDVYMYWGNKGMVASTASKIPFVEGDRVVVIGYLANHLYQYQTIAQWTLSVPLVITRAVIKPGEAAKYKAKNK